MDNIEYNGLQFSSNFHSEFRMIAFTKFSFPCIVLKQYREIVNTLPRPLQADTSLWKLQNFYDSCMDMDNINIDRERRLTDDIRELG